MVPFSHTRPAVLETTVVCFTVNGEPFFTYCRETLLLPEVHLREILLHIALFPVYYFLNYEHFSVGH